MTNEDKRQMEEFARRILTDSHDLISGNDYKDLNPTMYGAKEIIDRVMDKAAENGWDEEQKSTFGNMLLSVMHALILQLKAIYTESDLCANVRKSDYVMIRCLLDVASQLDSLMDKEGIGSETWDLADRLWLEAEELVSLISWKENTPPLSNPNLPPEDETE